MKSDAISQLQQIGLTIGKTSLNTLLKVEMEKCEDAARLIKTTTEKGEELDLEEMSRLPHIHLGESNFPTRTIDNGDLCNLLLFHKEHEI